jgi:hypothetical protein
MTLSSEQWRRSRARAMQVILEVRVALRPHLVIVSHEVEKAANLNLSLFRGLT